MMHYDDNIRAYVAKLKSSSLMVTTVCPNCGEPIVVRSNNLVEDVAYYAKSCPQSKQEEVK